VHVLGELVVGHGAVGLGASHAEHARGGRALAELQSGHALGSKSPRLSGVFRANVVVTVPLSSRRTSPVSVPAGGSSAVAVTPRSASPRIVRSQRTGRVTCPTSRSR